MSATAEYQEMDQGEAAVLALLTIEGMGSDDSQRKKKMKKLAAQNPGRSQFNFNTFFDQIG